jgi:formyl-CoA transferase
MTGKGSVVEVSMMSSVYPSLLSNLGMHSLGDKRVKRTGNRHGGLTMAPYNVYPTADGQIAILSVSDAHFAAIAGVLERPQWLTDPRFAHRNDRIAHMDALDAAIASATSLHPKDDLFKRLVAQRVPCAPVRELDDIVNDEHLHATGMLKWIDHPIYGRVLVHGSPLVFQDLEEPAYRASTALGADAREVLEHRLGIDAEEFDALARSGAFS